MSADNDWQTLVNIAHAQSVRGISPLRPLTSHRNLESLLAQRVSAQPLRPLLVSVDAQGYLERTYRDFANDVRQLAGHLRKLSLWRSDRVAALTSGTEDILQCLFAAWTIGASMVPLSADDDDGRIAANLREANARLFVTTEPLITRARLISAEAPGLPQPTLLSTFRHEAGTACGERVAAVEPARDDEALFAVAPDPVGASGALLNHYNLLATADSLARWNRWTPFDRIACSLPLSSVTGIVGGLIAPLCAGASICLFSFDAGTYWRHIGETRATVSMLMPGQLCALVDAPGVARLINSRLSSVICAGGPVQLDIVRAFEARFGIPVRVAAGQPETSGWSFQESLDASAPARLAPPGADGRASIGYALDVNEARLVDVSGTQPRAGDMGNIFLRGHNVMQGYYQRPDANRQAFATAWFDTGRSGCLHVDAEGRQIFQRKCNQSGMAERDGVLLSLADVDRVLAEMPGTLQAIAVAFDNTHHGEEIGACVAVEAGMHVTEDAVLSFCRQRLGFAKSPKVVVFGDPLRSGSSAFDREALRPLFLPHLATRFAADTVLHHAESLTP